VGLTDNAIIGNGGPEYGVELMIMGYLPALIVNDMLGSEATATDGVSGGLCALTGTIGQSDAARSDDGRCGLLGGFWSVDASGIIVFDDFVRFAEQWLGKR